MFISCVVSIFVWDNLDKFLSVVGALTCTPIAFTLPTWFHLKVSAKTDFERRSDKVLIGLSLVIMVWCTFYAFYTWND